MILLMIVVVIKYIDDKTVKTQVTHYVGAIYNINIIAP